MNSRPTCLIPTSATNLARNKSMASQPNPTQTPQPPNPTPFAQMTEYVDRMRRARHVRRKPKRDGSIVAHDVSITNDVLEPRTTREARKEWALKKPVDFADGNLGILTLVRSGGSLAGCGAAWCVPVMSKGAGGVATLTNGNHIDARTLPRAYPPTLTLYTLPCLHDRASADHARAVPRRRSGRRLATAALRRR